MINRTISLFIALILLAGLSQAADWPQFNGAGRDDISKETGLLKKWPEAGPKMAWETKELGGGFSGVSVAKGRVFTMGDLADACYVFAINEADGKVVWKAKIGEPGGTDEERPGPRCTPTVDGDLVFALGQWGDLVCLKTADGSEVWRKNIKKDFAGKTPHWDYSESPLVDGDQVVCTPGGEQGSVLALNKKTGEKFWQSKDVRNNATYSSLVPAEIGGVRQYIQLSDTNVYSVAAKDGKLMWYGKRPGRVAVITTPVFSDGVVFVTSGYGVGCSAFKIDTPAAGAEIKPLYATKDMANQHGGVVAVDGYIYGYDDNSNSFRCMDLKTGKVAWSEKSIGKSSETYADGHFYLRHETAKGTVALVEATPKGYKEVSKFDQPDRSDKFSWPHPVISNGKLYLRDQGVLLCYEIKD